ncbi:MAG: molybdenum cofactor guanylyltransferase [Candidatus Altiarchaeota archaeon]|nr:molybdenum cofactor guanylyltransferase [Candidatus Altiarchaeota archaeon]
MLLGESRRLLNKPFHLFRGRELFLHGHSILEEVFDSVLVICESPLVKRLGDYGLRYYSENYHAGPMGGIYKAAESLDNEYMFIFACDMPFLNIEVIEYMRDNSESWGCVIPQRSDGNVEPLHAIYRRDLVLDLLADGFPENKRVSFLVENIDDVSYVKEDTLRQFDKGLTCFRNINTPRDLSSASP